MKLEDEALPIHEDAEIKARERIFLEGNLFLDIKPGSPSADTIDDGDTIPASQTSAPVQLDQVLGTLQIEHAQGPAGPARRATATRSTASRSPARTTTRTRTSKGETARPGAERLARLRARRAARHRDREPGRARHAAARPVEADRRPAEGLRGARQPRGPAEGPDHELQHDGGGARRREEGNLSETMRELPEMLEAAQPALDNLNAAFPSTRAWALEMIPGVEETPATLDAALPVGAPDARADVARRAPGARWPTSSRPSATSPSSPTGRWSCSRCSTRSTAASTTWCCRAASR